MAKIEQRAESMFRGMKTKTARETQNMHKMSKKEALACQKQLQSIQLELMQKIVEDIPREQREEEMQGLIHMLSDTFYSRTGLEMDQLDVAFQELELFNDPEYQSMLKDFNIAL